MIHEAMPDLVIVQAGPPWASLRGLGVAVAQAPAGRRVALAIALDTPILWRLITLLTFRLQRRRAERIIIRAGGNAVTTYGVEPTMSEPAFLYEMDSAASEYADRCLRPRGSALTLRRLLARCFGYDPALGGLLVVGRKS
ncbi:MAG: hypothetical protein ABI665_11395 [Vicinamibacterales bacterium]